MGFQDTLKIECLPAKETLFRYRLLESFIYVTHDQNVIIVPRGFPTDFASVPWFFRTVIPKTGRYNEATVIHDYMCSLSNQGFCSRKEADRIFLECMQELGVKKWRRKVMYASVGIYTFFKRHGKK